VVKTAKEPIELWHREAKKNVSNMICQRCDRLYEPSIDKKKFDHHCVGHDYINGSCSVLCPKCHGIAKRICRNVSKYLGLLYENPLKYDSIYSVLELCRQWSWEFYDVSGDVILYSLGGITGVFHVYERLEYEEARIVLWKGESNE